MSAIVNGKRLRFGVHAPPEGKDFETMKGLCQTAERLGYDVFTMTDHFMNMADPSGRENHPLECWTTLAGLAAVTNKITLGPLVSCANYRHPTVLAKIATTLDIISGGRFLFGIGAGWHEIEFKGFMGQFPSPKERLNGLEDAVQICRSMFDNEFTSFTGKLYSAENTLNSPRPIQKSIPIMVGGSGERRTLKIAAKYADISHVISNYPQDVEHKLEVLKAHCNRVKRNFSDIRIATGFRPMFEPSKQEIKAQTDLLVSRRNVPQAEAERIVRTTIGPENILDRMRTYQHLGVALVTLNNLGIEEMKQFKEQIISKLGQ